MRHCYFPVPKWLLLGRRRAVVGVAHRGEAVRVVALRRGRQAAVVARDGLDPPRADRRRPHQRARSSRSTRRSTRSCGCCSRSGCTRACRRDNDTILAALNGGLAWHRRRKAKIGSRRTEDARRDSAAESRNSCRDPADQTRMTFDGIAAVQARIQEIQQQVSAALAPDDRRRPRASGATTGADFASLLTDAMNTQTAAASAARPTRPTGDDGLLGHRASLSGLVSEPHRQRRRARDTGTTSPDVTHCSRASRRRGAARRSPDISSLISSLTGAARPAPARPRRRHRRRTRRRSSSSTPRSARTGKPYVWGSTASPTDPEPGVVRLLRAHEVGRGPRRA